MDRLLTKVIVLDTDRRNFCIDEVEFVVVVDVIATGHFEAGGFRCEIQTIPVTLDDVSGYPFLPDGGKRNTRAGIISDDTACDVQYLSGVNSVRICSGAGYTVFGYGTSANEKLRTPFSEQPRFAALTDDTIADGMGKFFGGVALNMHTIPKVSCYFAAGHNKLPIHIDAGFSLISGNGAVNQGNEGI